MDYKQYLTTVATLKQAATIYYNGIENPILSDTEYDLLLLEVETVGNQNGWTEHDALNQVAAGTTPSTDTVVQHPIRLLSLQKAQTLEGLAAFITKTGTASFSLEPKIDGLAVIAHYLDGKLTLVATRGDSRTGQNITERIRTLHANNKLSGLPLTLPKPYTGYVTGEAYTATPDFDSSNKTRTENNQPAYKTARNATSGNLLAKPTHPTDLNISFAAYDTNLHKTATTHTEAVTLLEQLGFNTARQLYPTRNNVSSLKEEVKQFGNLRHTIPTPTDGIVIKVNDYETRELLGETDKHPNWAIAYKYETETQQTILLDIQRNIGRTGAVSYTAIMNPVELEGTTVQKATLNNADFIRNLDLHLGDTIYIRKANEIIPEIIGVNKTLRPKNSTPYQAPATCPDCSQPLNQSSTIWKCDNPACSQTRLIQYAASDKALNIDGLSLKTIQQLTEAGHIRTVPDLYNLTIKQIANTPTGRINKEGQPILIGEKTATQLHQNIQASLNSQLHRILISLGIPTLGERLTRRLIQHLHTWDNITTATTETLQQIEGIKDKAHTIHEGFRKRRNLLTQYELTGYPALTPKNTPQEKHPTQPQTLKGQTIVITGNIPNHTRAQYQAKLEAHGATTSNTVTSKTTLLIAPANERNTSKAIKAQKQGTPILTPEEFTKQTGI